MRSFLTSYAAMFERSASGGASIERIEIPLIQRDYAQGRTRADVADIRNSFLDVIQEALSGGESVGLDFVYGEVKDGTLSPLDGQQRLTTLFLLHWYLASRAELETADAAWTKFSYATRASAELFCQRLVFNPPPPAVDTLSRWITDQSWYQFVWRHDPTIQSMLVMIDAIHDRFASADAEALWTRLTDPDEAAVYFYLLPIENMGQAEDLYIKMNSRGKPLTEFETFKARFESAIRGTSRADEFARKVDNDWTDLLWPLHGPTNTVDAEFMRYFEFVIEICEWQQGPRATGRLERRAEGLFAPGQPNADQNIGFLFSAFDTWAGTEKASDVFDRAFRAGDSIAEAGDKVSLYGPGLKLNLFETCCRTYGDVVNNRRSFSLSDTLLLYAVLLHRIHDTEDFPRRLRVVRNLNEASVANELRLDRMPELLASVHGIIVDGALDRITGFNQNQIADEQHRASILAEHPELQATTFALEDHALLRGSLVSFDLEADTLAVRADAFRSVVGPTVEWDEITGALLAVGDYSRPRYPGYWFGSPSHDSWWRDLLTTGSRAELAPLRRQLATLLDLVADSTTETSQALAQIRSDWLTTAERERWFDWRYYLTRYDVMRSGRSGIYGTPKSSPMGYSLAMLDGKQLNGHYRDAYLSALVEVSDAANAVETPLPDFRFTGYADQPRWLQLIKTGIRLQCVDVGFQLAAPPDITNAAIFRQVLHRHGVGDDLMLSVEQSERDGSLIDTDDRIQLGASLLRDLVAGGL